MRKLFFCMLGLAIAGIFSIDLFSQKKNPPPAPPALKLHLQNPMPPVPPPPPPPVPPSSPMEPPPPPPVMHWV